MRILSSTACGNKPMNQDVVLKWHYLQQNGQEVICIGVLDGHGVNGHLCAMQVHDWLVAEFKRVTQWQALLDSDDSLIDLFMRCDQSLLTRQDFDAALSGTTCTLVFLFTGRATVVHIGDCRALLCLSDATTQELTVQPLTADHSVESERQRLQECGATINQLMDPDTQQFYGPMRIFKSSMPYPGLAMSRSFGDSVGKKLGVICTPHIQRVKLTGDSRFVVVACDGVWDALTNEQVGRYIMKHHADPEVSQKLTSKSIKSLDRLQLDDNSSNVIAFF